MKNMREATLPQTPTDGPSAATEGSEMALVYLRGGTQLLMSAERGEGKPYDRLLALLDECMAWSEDDGAWMDGGATIRGAQVLRSQNDKVSPAL